MLQTRETFLAALQTIEVTRLISDFENSDLEQTVDISETVSKFVVILESGPKQSLQLGYVKQKRTNGNHSPGLIRNVAILGKHLNCFQQKTYQPFRRTNTT